MLSLAIAFLESARPATSILERARVCEFLDYRCSIARLRSRAAVPEKVGSIAMFGLGWLRWVHVSSERRGAVDNNCCATLVLYGSLLAQFGMGQWRARYTLFINSLVSNCAC